MEEAILGSMRWSDQVQAMLVAFKHLGLVDLWGLGPAGARWPRRLRSGAVISHKYRGSCVAFSISKSVEPNEELKVG